MFWAYTASAQGLWDSLIIRAHECSTIDCSKFGRYSHDEQGNKYNI